jgi:DNA replication and repair protein RecF
MLYLLSARDFRNLRPLDWTPGAGSHLLLGGNGAGKTSVLEAIYTLATTRSFRTAQLAECVRHGADSFHLRGEVHGERRIDLEVGWTAGERARLVNGKSGPLSSHLAALPVVAWTSAAEAEVLVGPPAARRRFLDRGILGLRPTLLEVLSRHREALLNKRRLLLDGGEIEVWNEMLADLGAEIIAQRGRYVDQVATALREVVALSELPFPPIELKYRPSPAAGLHGRGAIAEALAHAAASERRRGIPLVGPHRDQLEILWNGHEIRRVASAGERKALSLLLLGAHARVLAHGGRDPLVLLDDADAELAPPTVAAVWRVFAGAPQVIASSNRPQVWLTLDVGTLWEMERGELRLLS